MYKIYCYHQGPEPKLSFKNGNSFQYFWENNIKYGIANSNNGDMAPFAILDEILKSEEAE